jgi:hypothetical protein
LNHHKSFVERESQTLNAKGAPATAYGVGGEDEGNDCSEGFHRLAIHFSNFS